MDFRPVETVKKRREPWSLHWQDRDFEIAFDVVESLGFRPVDAGSLAAARTLEGMGWLNISRNMQGGTWQDAWVLLGPDSRS